MRVVVAVVDKLSPIGARCLDSYRAKTGCGIRYGRLIAGSRKISRSRCRLDRTNRCLMLGANSSGWDFCWIQETSRMGDAIDAMD